MKYQLNINIEPYSNVIIDGNTDEMESTEEICLILTRAIMACDLKNSVRADIERSKLVTEIEVLMGEKEFDSLGLCEYLETINLMRETLLKCDTQKLRYVLDGLKQKPNRKD